MKEKTSKYGVLVSGVDLSSYMRKGSTNAKLTN